MIHTNSSRETLRPPHLPHFSLEKTDQTYTTGGVSGTQMSDVGMTIWTARKGKVLSVDGGAGRCGLPRVTDHTIGSKVKHSVQVQEAYLDRIFI